VLPSELEKLRASGEPHPGLPPGTSQIAQRTHVTTIAMVVSLCLSEAGVPTTVELTQPSTYDEANQKILKDVHAWRFHPYVVGGQALPVCTRMRFVYQLE
jgi:hypothetical protein